MSEPVKSDPPVGRVARRQQRNRTALIRAARAVMAEKGIDAATMLEIAERADVGAGTVYNYFKSKDDLAVAVLEAMMHDLAIRIEKVTDTFDDPAQVYAFGVRTVLDTATHDPRWRQGAGQPARPPVAVGRHLHRAFRVGTSRVHSEGDHDGLRAVAADQGA